MMNGPNSTARLKILTQFVLYPDSDGFVSESRVLEKMFAHYSGIEERKPRIVWRCIKLVVRQHNEDLCTEKTKLELGPII